MPDKDRVYIDTCCFIDMVKQQVGAFLEPGRAEDVWHAKHLLQAARDGEIDVYTSVLTIAECQHADGIVTEEIKSVFNRLLMSGQYVKLIQPTPFIAVDAQQLRWRHQILLRGADALHIASALTLKCQEFLTTDGRIAKIGNQHKLGLMGLKLVKPAATACLPAKYRQLALPGHEKGESLTQH